MRNYRIFARARLSRATVLTSVLTLLASGAAAAQDRETFRCNAPYGAYDDIVLPVRGVAFEVTGRINFLSAHPGPFWQPLAHVYIANSHDDAPGCHCTGIAINTREGWTSAGYGMVVDGRYSEMGGRSLRIPITFSLAVASDGTMTVRIGKTIVDTLTAKLSRSGHDQLVLSCASAEVSFLNVEVR